MILYESLFEIILGLLPKYSQAHSKTWCKSPLGDSCNAGFKPSSKVK